MERPTVAVTYSPADEERQVYRELLSDLADLVFLPDLDAEARSQALRGSHVLMSGSIRREVSADDAQLLRNAHLIQILSAGADAVPFERIPPGIEIASNVGAFSEPIAEHVMAMVLALAKRIVIEDIHLREGVFDHKVKSRTVAGMTAGIVGFGGIGKATARLMRGFDMRILAVNRTGETDEPVEFAGSMSDLDRVLSGSDVVVLSLPLTADTRGLIDKRRLELMKRNAILVNVARGALIDEEALYRHAKNDPEFLVGLDVWWDEPFRDGAFHSKNPILALPNVIGSPHNSGNVPGIGAVAARHAAANVRRFLTGEPLRGVVRREEYLH